MAIPAAVPADLTAAPGVPDDRSRHAALDGLRTVAVVLVVLYHLGVPGLGGGFVGVDLFFVISGYLITALLLREVDRTGGIAVGDFLRRRVRRLWPLAWVVLAAVAVAGAVGVWDASQRKALPVETAAALALVANWQQALGGGYVRQFVAPSPLRHFWSLAIEEQFYLLWPAALLGATALAARWTPRRRSLVPAVMVAALVLVSVASGFAMDPSWAYLSTVTRMVALLAGAALALAWRPHPLAAPVGPRVYPALLAAGAAGAVVVGVLAVVARPEDAWLGHGGFALVALAGTAVVAACLGGVGGALLASGTMVWLGRRSYGIYLVHWPLVVALGPGRPVWLRCLVVLPASVALAALLHHVVEEPARLRRVRPALLGLAGVVVLAVTATALWAGAPQTATAEERVARTLERRPDPTTTVPTTVPATVPPTTVAGGPPAAPPTAPPTVAPTTLPPCVSDGPGTGRDLGSAEKFDERTVADVADPTVPTCSGAVKVLVVGDSMARGLANGMAAMGWPSLQLWDRSRIGCSFEGPSCPDWRTLWSESVRAIDPDVVVLFTNVQPDLSELRGTPFLSPEGKMERIALFAEAYRLLGSGGARVLVHAPTLPLRPNGLFYCSGRTTGTACDPRWVDAWTSSMRTAAVATGASLLDTPGWAASRRATFRRDRPDGVHFVGPALESLARWVGLQVLGARQ
ncbi:MAG: acyltransferase family protein [Actinomycetes bacterium]